MPSIKKDPDTGCDLSKIDTNSNLPDISSDHNLSDIGSDYDVPDFRMACDVPVLRNSGVRPKTKFMKSTPVGSPISPGFTLLKSGDKRHPSGYSSKSRKSVESPITRRLTSQACGHACDCTG